MTELTLSVRAFLLAGLLAAAAWCACAAAVTDARDAEMVAIPEGSFTMGSPRKAMDEDPCEAPVQELTLPGFSIDKYEVTTAQYARFLNAVRRTRDEAGREMLGLDDYLPLAQVAGAWQPKPGLERHPMVNVTWYGAMAYARWAGKRLPTEAEWEKAARGSDGRKYPWGSTLDFRRFRLGVDQMVPVGSFPAGASPYGCLDMTGNAWEWTSSLFRPYPYDAKDGREDPQAPGRRVARGGSFAGEPEVAHSAYRFHPEPEFHHRYLGFRCAR